MSVTRLTWLILPVVALGAMMRFHNIRQPYTDVFSWRQASTAMMADNFYRRSANIFYPEVSWTGPGPSYQGREFQTISYVASLVYRIVGQQDWVGRSLAAICGTWSVLALFLLARRVWDEPRALLAALIYAVMPGAVLIDRSFLPDPCMLALALTAAWLYVAYLQTGRKRRLVLAALFGTWALLTKLPCIVALLPLGHATVSCLRQRNQLTARALVRISAVLFLCLVPIAGYYAWALHLGRTYPPYHVAGSANWLWKNDIFWWASRWWFLPELFRFGDVWLWTAPAWALALAGLFFTQRLPERLSATQAPLPYFFHYWLAGCGVLVFVGARELSENPWNLHVFSPLVAAFAAHGLFVLATATADRAWRLGPALRVGLAMGLLLLTSRAALRSMYHSANADATMRLGLALRELSNPDDLIVTVAHDIGDPIGIYYAQRRGWVFPVAHDTSWRAWNMLPADESVSIRMLEDLRHRGARWFGIVNAARDDAKPPQKFWSQRQLAGHLERTCERVIKNDQFVIYRIPPLESAASDQ